MLTVVASQCVHEGVSLLARDDEHSHSGGAEPHHEELLARDHERSRPGGAKPHRGEVGSTLWSERVVLSRATSTCVASP